MKNRHLRIIIIHVVGVLLIFAALVFFGGINILQPKRMPIPADIIEWNGIIFVDS